MYSRGSTQIDRQVPAHFTYKLCNDSQPSPVIPALLKGGRPLATAERLSAKTVLSRKAASASVLLVNAFSLLRLL